MSCIACFYWLIWPVVPFSFFLEAIVKELVVNAADQMGSFSPQLWLRVFTMHWAVDNRWDCCWLVNQSESGRCLASAYKPLFGIWGLMGVGSIITLNQSEFCFIWVFFFFLHEAIMWNGHASYDNKSPHISTPLLSNLPEPHILDIFSRKRLWLNQAEVSFSVFNSSDDKPPSYLIFPS